MNNFQLNRLNYLEDFVKILDQNIIYCRITEDGIIIEASDMFCKITKYSKKELQGEYYNTLKTSPCDTWDKEIEYKTKDNKLIWLEVIKIPQYDEHKNFLCYLLTHQDISSNKQVKSLNESLELSILQTANESMKVHHLNITLEKRVHKAIEENKKQEEQLLEKSKLAIMGEMIAMIAHQWKQPINVLSLNMASLEVMQMTQEYDFDELKHIIDNSNTTIEYMTKTISDFSEFLKPDNEYCLVNANMIFFQLESLIKNDIKRNNIDFSIIYDLKMDDKIKISLSKFTQVMINLVKNSIDEFKRNTILNPCITIDITKKSNDFLIKVKDNAGGIPKSVLKTIFEPYSSTKGKNGTGLGMYMSKLIVEGHLNGKIKVESKNNHAMICIYIPI